MRKLCYTIKTGQQIRNEGIHSTYDDDNMKYFILKLHFRIRWCYFKQIVLNIRENISIGTFDYALWIPLFQEYTFFFINILFVNRNLVVI